MAARVSAAVVLFFVMLSWTTRASAQGIGATLVHDPWILEQSIMEAARLLELYNLAIRDLAPFAQLGDALAVVGDLEAVLNDVNEIAGRMNGRHDLWRSIVMPTSMAEFGQLRRNLTQVCRTSAEDGLEAQSIVMRITGLLSRLTRLLQDLSTILGTVAGLQAANGVLADLSGQVAILTAAATAAHEPMLCDRWQQQVKEQAIETMQMQLLQDYAVWPGQ